MAVKTITITEKAYSSLKAKKGKKESFSDTILRVTRKGNIMDFFGVLNPKEANELETIIKENRKRHRMMHRKRVKRIKEALDGRS